MKCVQQIKNNGFPCTNSKCDYYLDYEKDLNCMNIAIENNGAMTLRDIAERLNYSFVRIKQIEDEGKQKIKEYLDKEYYL